MKTLLKSLLAYVLPLGIGIFLFWYVVIRQVSLEELLSTFREAKPGWIAASFFFGLLSHWARAYRWKYLLEPLGYRVSGFRAFIAVMVGYFANLLVPRMGELARCGVLQKAEGVPAQSALGTVVSERIIDVIILFSLVVSISIIEFEHLGKLVLGVVGAKLQGLAQSGTTFYLIVGAILCLGAAFAFYLYRRREQLLQKPLAKKIWSFLQDIVQGVKSIRHVRQKGAFIGFTALIWLMYYVMAYVLFFCFPETSQLGLMAGMSILIMGGIGMAAPVQGGIGTYHILVSQTLLVYGIAQSQGIAFAAFMHAMQTAVIVIFGGLAFLISIFLKKKNPVAAVS